ncbi:hypothetical protein QJS04_geneDACA020393 [Acorus gramineus]|uniref:Uncharacterized protein n=1 Tax=Acorus gramineus TaxID=55184 RepID=A0AAV9BKR6_ACOGR|nr:hypothetical protein QJS04_geneDACA020393 [Acorus gramineus]
MINSAKYDYTSRIYFGTRDMRREKGINQNYTILLAIAVGITQNQMEHHTLRTHMSHQNCRVNTKVNKKEEEAWQRSKEEVEENKQLIFIPFREVDILTSENCALKNELQQLSEECRKLSFENESTMYGPIVDFDMKISPWPPQYAFVEIASLMRETIICSLQRNDFMIGSPSNISRTNPFGLLIRLLDALALGPQC